MKNTICKLFVILLGFMIFAETAQSAKIMIQNKGFETMGEDGNPAGWEPSSWGDITVSFDYPVVGRKGGNNKGAGITVLSANTAVSDRGASWRSVPGINVQGVQRFKYIDWVKANTNAYLDVEFEMQNGDLVYQSLGGISDTGGAWKKTITQIVIPPGAMTMSVYRVIKEIGSFALDDVALAQMSTPKNASGFVTFSFDDGLSQQDVPALLRSLKILGTFYINPIAITQQWSTNYFTPEEVRAIAADGNEVGNHSGQHLNLTQLSDSDLFTEVKGSKDALEQMIGGVAFTFAYPYGEYSQKVIDLVKSTNHIAARGVEAGDGIDAGINTPTQDKYTLHSACIRNTATVDDVKMMINYAAETEQWLILCFHQFDQTGEWNYPLSDLKKIIKYAKKKTRIVTVQQGVLNYLQQ